MLEHWSGGATLKGKTEKKESRREKKERGREKKEGKNEENKSPTLGFEPTTFYSIAHALPTASR